MLEEDRVMFLFKDGAAAWDAKDFLLEQERCEDVQLEQQTYHGKYSSKKKQEEEEKKEQKRKAKRDKKEGKDKKKKAKKEEL